MSSNTKNERYRLSLRVSPVTHYRLYTVSKKEGYRSMNELAERAIEFYLKGNVGAEPKPNRNPAQRLRFGEEAQRSE